MKDHGVSLNQHCPCAQKQCPVLGNCVLCVQRHLDHRKHIPECMQDILRDSVRDLAAKMEYRVAEGRPNAAFWKKVDKAAAVREGKAEQRKKK